MKQVDLFDGDALPVEAQDLAEADIQSACIDHVRRLGAYARKFSSPANRSVPDYIITLHGRTWYVEFKRKGKKPTEAQADEHKKILAAGGSVWVIDDVDRFKRMVAAVCATGAL